MLRPKDLEGLEPKERRNPYDDRAVKMKLYRLSDLRDRCVRRWGSIEEAHAERARRFAAALVKLGIDDKNATIGGTHLATELSVAMIHNVAVAARQSRLGTTTDGNARDGALITEADAAVATTRAVVLEEPVSHTVRELVDGVLEQRMLDAKRRLRRLHKQERDRQSAGNDEATALPSLASLLGEGAGTTAVATALATNAGLFVAKLGAFFFTGSASMLSEAVHSFADTGNQVLLAVGIRQAAKARTAEHPYGFQPERYIWSLISGVGIFFIGCGVSVVHGIHGLMHPQPMESVPIALAVLCASLGLEGYSLRVALTEVREEARAKGLSVAKLLLRPGGDPANQAVLMEDLAAVIGAGIAGVGIGLSYITGSPIFDSLGSIAVGGLLGVVAIALVQRNRAMLIGMSVPQVRMEGLDAMLIARDAVESVHDIRAILQGDGDGRFRAEIAFSVPTIAARVIERRGGAAALTAQMCGDPSTEGGRETGREVRDEDIEGLLALYLSDAVDVLSEEADEIEALVRAELPEMRHVDIHMV